MQRKWIKWGIICALVVLSLLPIIPYYRTVSYSDLCGGTEKQTLPDGAFQVCMQMPWEDKVWDQKRSLVYIAIHESPRFIALPGAILQTLWRN